MRTLKQIKQQDGVNSLKAIHIQAEEAKSEMAAATGSAAVLKAEIGAWKEAAENFGDTYKLHKGTLISLLGLMERMCAVIENLETREPPNDTAQTPRAND